MGYRKHVWPYSPAEDVTCISGHSNVAVPIHHMPYVNEVGTIIHLIQSFLQKYYQNMETKLGGGLLGE